MARMYSRKKGKSKSTKPIKKELPSWLRYKPNEVELLVTKLAKDDISTSKIGLYLRDMYGIPDVKSITKKSISHILKEKKILSELPEDLTALIKKSVLIRKHLEANKKDMPAKRGLQLTESKISRLVNYYKRKGVLSDYWKYDSEKASLLVQ